MKKLNLISLIIFIFILLYFVLEVDSKARKCNDLYVKNNYYIKNNYCNKYYNKVCVTYKYVHYNNKDINYNHPHALYPLRAVELYPIYNSNSYQSNYVVGYNIVYYPYLVYYYLLGYNNYCKPLSYLNYLEYSKYSNYSSSLSSSKFSSYSSYYYGYYDPNYLNYPSLKIEVKKVGYYDYKTGEFKESSF